MYTSEGEKRVGKENEDEQREVKKKKPCRNFKIDSQISIRQENESTLFRVSVNRNKFKGFREGGGQLRKKVNLYNRFFSKVPRKMLNKQFLSAFMITDVYENKDYHPSLTPLSTSNEESIVNSNCFRVSHSNNS